MPRHTDYNPSVHTAIVRALQIGITRKASAHIGGITYTTLRTWLQRGEAGEEPFEQFLFDVNRAEAEVEKSMTACVLEAAVKKKDWRAAQLYLERRSPEWTPKSNLSVADELQKVLDAVENSLGVEAMEKVLVSLQANGTRIGH